MSGINTHLSASTFETIARRLDGEIRYWWQEAALWFSRRSDGEQLVIGCLLVLFLLMLIFRMSMRSDAGGGKHFGGSLFTVMIFAFGLGWMLDSGAGSLSFVFN